MSEPSDTPRTEQLHMRLNTGYEDILSHARELERELTAALVDAERYRWLREQHEALDLLDYDGEFFVQQQVCDANPSKFDAAIDAAMREEKP